MSKNLSFKRLILILTATSMTVMMCGMLLNVYLSDSFNPFVSMVLLLLVCGAALYIILHYLLNTYLYRRIKLIYKIIRSRRGTVPGKVENEQRRDSLAQVENEVNHWMSEQQREIESLKELENYRKNFLGDISHELKTPIFAVQGYIHTLLDGGLEDAQVNKRFLKKAAQNIERLETIVEDLDVIAKLENATMQLDVQTFDLKALANEVIEQVEVQATSRDISVKYKNGANRAFSIRADREYIRTVLINLIVNSIKYGQEGGETKISFYDMENYILVEIADNGIGIEEKHLKHLFDRFYRVDKSRSRQGGGSGLGLSIVKHIVEAHAQSVNVRRTLGVGTTMGFTLEKAK